MTSINIIGEQTSGLAVDSRMIAAALSQGHFKTRICKVRPGLLNSLFNRVIPSIYWKPFQKNAPDINIFCEQIFDKWLKTSNVNIFIPNQEWCRPATLELLPRMDYVLCKTRHAEDIFSSMGLNTIYIGFTSDDHYDESIKKDYRRYLHVAGKSLQKGTVPLARVWSKHPEWPTLTIVTHNPKLISEYESPNIKIESQISIEHLRFLQNQCGIHVCPSEAEGFGHVINEALACGAVVVTTNAAPMNELVNSNFGYLVAYGRTSPQSLSTNFYIDENELQQVIQETLTLNHEYLNRMSLLSRSKYLETAKNFKSNLIEILRNLDPKSHHL